MLARRIMIRANQGERMSASFLPEGNGGLKWIMKFYPVSSCK
jgi:hypothetical protein